MLGKKVVLVVGNGGREHAICWKLSESEKVEKIYVLPGSAGIERVNKCENVKDVDIKDFQGIASLCKTKNIDLVIVGPEDPLANGLSDVLQTKNIQCFGPGKDGARIESDKKWAKDFMIRHSIPTAKFESFTEAEKAKKFIQSAPFDALVVKASGLAAGKGVVVASNTDEACQAVDDILGEKKFGKAGEVIVIEELLTGEEISVLAFVDTQNVSVMLPAQDHKRLKENDEGPNTGGMGAYCPCPLISKADIEIVKKEVLQKAVDGLRSEGIQYCGVLYAGIMLTPKGPMVLEFNCRFGDPETQVILPLLKTDLFEVMSACCANKLNELDLQWENNLNAVGVVMASAGYPETSTKGCVIEGIPENSTEDIIFHSGVAINDEKKLVTNGGRVLIAVALRKDLKLAAAEATSICQNIKFLGKGSQFRTDIAQKALKMQSLSYKESGVDIDAGDDFVQRIKPLCRGTHRLGVIGGLGGFGGLFSLNKLSYKNPVLCEATNGVGSKIKLALDNEMYETIGFDLLAMCVNDVLESGAEPVAFLDYIACGKLQVPLAAQIVKGISEGCRAANCALLGGETAEMPSVYDVGKYDMAGYCLGILEDGTELPRYDNFKDGDLIIGLQSSGLHCAGFELVCNALDKMGISCSDISEFGDGSKTLGQDLAYPTRIYVNDVLPLLKTGLVKAISHVSSSLEEGLTKLSTNGFQLDIDFEKFQIPQIYGWIMSKLSISERTLINNFNCGLGMILVVSKECTEWQKIPYANLIGKINFANLTNPIKISNFKFDLKNTSAMDSINLSRRVQTDIETDKSRRLLNDVQHRQESFVSQGGRRLTRVSKTFKDPVLIIGTDGCGTKIKIAQETQLNSTVGIDLVAMCVNDILCNGAEPLTFSSYFACGNLDRTCFNNIMTGIVDGSKKADSSLIDIHTIEVPLLYQPKAYDLAGFSLGIAENDKILPRTNEICEGDSLIAIPSSGVHSNGFSLVHAVMKLAGVSFFDVAPFSGKTFGEEFLTPTEIYVHAIAPLLSSGKIKALAHITGGGLIENIPRVLSKDIGVHLDANCFVIPPVFAWIAAKGRVASYEMLRTYNCGIGMILVVDPKYEADLLQALRFTHRATKVGSVVKKTNNTQQVVVDNFNDCLLRTQRLLEFPLKRVAVLISGSGTNLQALIDASRNSALGLFCEIVLVISNKPDVYGLKRAEKSCIPSIVISHKNFKNREEFDLAMSNELEKQKVDIVCCAGFMRILTQTFVRKWKGKLINIHPALLPKHPGLNVQQKAIDAGDTESGCTVHFVDEGVDTGAVILQERVPILPSDTADTLSQRILEAEHYAYPQALRLISTGVVGLDKNGHLIKRN
ncbi:trifunctional purine biosynthetic protein adenosine-3 [Episyrphus balteatus]|uniref:trifunctional purine biosynthetic protein adenosine-3 n=1 Tax=Episyrphus balteatus TaxID=286459 RepID=UPI002486114D|nr:trifunctional purine biosynthetic protein adenosine-3 [Episyrphus balteatus]